MFRTQNGGKKVEKIGQIFVRNSLSSIPVTVLVPEMSVFCGYFHIFYTVPQLQALLLGVEIQEDEKAEFLYLLSAPLPNSSAIGVFQDSWDWV